MLASRRDSVFSRKEILDKVWGRKVYVTNRTVDVHIKRLREKLSRFPYRQFILDLVNEAFWNDIKVFMVTPFETSITCPRCGYVDKANRPTRNLFKCIKCNYTDSPDRVACLNLVKKVKQILTIPITNPQ